MQAAVQQVQNIINRCLTIHDKLEASLSDLSRTGDIQACKAARKAADGSLKELIRELKPLLSFLQSSQQAAQIFPKVWLFFLVMLLLFLLVDGVGVVILNRILHSPLV